MPYSVAAAMLTSKTDVRCKVIAVLTEEYAMKKVLLATFVFYFLKASSVLGDPLACIFDGPSSCSCILTLTPQDCKIATPITYEARKHYFSSNDFNWKCNIIVTLEFDFFNSSTRTVKEIIIEGATFGTRLSESVDVLPGRSQHVYALSSGAFCRKEKQASLYFEYEVNTGGGECLESYSNAEIQTAQNQCRAEAARKEDEDTIYNNCVVSKSHNVDSSAMRNVRSVCREVSRNPTLLQRWHWGS